jgi:hypothetical protein
MSSAQSVTASFNASSGSGGGSGATTYGNNGNPWGIGSGTRRIEAENYDTGGEGVGYHDASSANEGGQYRSDGVDVEAASGGGYDVGWVSAGEWMQYSVDVATAGDYELSLRVARKAAGTGGVRVLVGGGDLTGELAVPVTGGWQTWVDVKKTVTLAAGRQTMRIAAVGSEFNVNWIDVTQAGSSTAAPSGGTQQTYGNNGNPWPLGAGTTRIEAENFDVGGEGVAYHDVDAGNSGSSGRTEAVDLEGCSEGGYNVGWIASGEWLEYTVNVATAGNYDVALRVARLPVGDAQLRLLFANVDKTGDVAVPSTGGWQSWTTVTRTVSLAAGTQVLRLAMAGSEFNVNWIEVKAAGGATPTPTPLPPATGASLPLFDDNIASDWSDWSWSASVNTAATSPVKVGSKSIAATLSPYGAVSLRKGTAQSTAGYSALRFWVHGGSGSTKKLRVFTYTADGTGDGTRVQVDAPAGTWTEVNVPLVLLGNPAGIKRVAIQEGNGVAQPEIAIDELRLVQ